METADEDSIDLTLPVGRSRSNVVAGVTLPTGASAASSPPANNSAAGSAAVSSASAVRGGQRPSMPPAGAVAQQLRTFMSASAPAVTASASSSPGALKPSSAGTAFASTMHEQSAPAPVQVASTVKTASPAAVSASKVVAAAPAASSPSSGGSACNVDECVCTEFTAHPFKPNLCRDCRHAQTSHS
jgi:hypothetical protein